MINHNESKFIGSGGISLYYQSWHPEQSPRGAFVIVHGFGGHSGFFLNLAGSLTDQNYTTYAFDLRGHGRSPGQRGHIMSWEEYHNDLSAFLQMVYANEKTGTPVFLFGSSLGAAIVLDYILHDHEGLRGAAIDGAPIQPSGSASPGKVLVAKLLSGAIPTFQIKFGLEASAISRDQGFIRSFTSDPLVHDLVSVRWGTEVMKTIDNLKANASQINLPLLILHGEADSLNSPEGARWLFGQITYPDKELHIYPGMYHGLLFDHGCEQVIADMKAWMEKHL
jgi:alpha-beta hydrolase superfamily lysophospholipase